MGWNDPSPLDAFLSRGLDGAGRLFGLELPTRDWRRFLFALACAVGLLNAAGSIHDFFHYGGTDLRIRVVSARALLAGLDPYTLTDSPALPATLRDPHQQHAGLSRCTYPPTLLLVYATFTPLPYPAQRGLWMLLEWLALLATIALLARTLRARQVRFLFVVTALGLVGGSYFWRLHVERGQYYVFIGLLLAGGVAWCLRREREHWGAGLLLGAAAALRPTAVLALIPLGLAGRRRTVLAALASASLFVAVSLPFAGTTGWSQFFWLVGELERGGIDPGYLDRHYPRLEPPRPMPSSGPSDRPEPPPRPVETVDGFRPEIMSSLSVSVSAGNLGPLFARVGEWLPAEQVPGLIRLALAAVVAVFSVAFFLAQRRRPFSTRQALAAGMLLVLLADYFLPIRIGYADVLYLLPLALVMPALAMPRHRFGYGVLVVAFLPALLPIAPTSAVYWKFATVLRTLVLLAVTAAPVLAAIAARWTRRAKEHS